MIFSLRNRTKVVAVSMTREGRPINSRWERHCQRGLEGGSRQSTWLQHVALGALPGLAG
jgi:hypothetical protein